MRADQPGLAARASPVREVKHQGTSDDQVEEGTHSWGTASWGIYGRHDSWPENAWYNQALPAPPDRWVPSGKNRPRYSGDACPTGYTARVGDIAADIRDGELRQASWESLAQQEDLVCYTEAAAVGVGVQNARAATAASCVTVTIGSSSAAFAAHACV